MLQLGANIDMLPLHAAIMRQMLWGFGGPADSIILRGLDKSGKVVNYPAIDMLWQARPHIFGLMARVEGEELGEVEIKKIAPGTQMTIENEQGWQTYIYVLHCASGLALVPQMLRPGDAWCVDTGEILQNNSNEWAYVMLCTIKSAAPSTFIPETVNVELPD